MSEEISTELLIDLLDGAIDEIARLQKEVKEVKERAYDAGEMVFSMTEEILKVDQLVKNLESENESLRCSESFHETRDYNRSRKIGMQLQEGE